MHIPAGFLSPVVWAPMTGAAAVGVGYALKKTGAEFDEARTPIMGVMAAFIFAAQMVNFPVAGGTSGHLIGASLAVAIFGFRPAVVIMASVILVQCLIFQDGGLDALGANIINMGVLGCFISNLLLKAGRLIGRSAFYPSVALGAWLSVMGAAAACALELAFSGTSPLRLIFPAMASIHALIGIFEGIITVTSLKFIISVKPSAVQFEGKLP